MFLFIFLLEVRLENECSMTTKRILELEVCPKHKKVKPRPRPQQMILWGIWFWAILLLVSDHSHTCPSLQCRRAPLRRPRMVLTSAPWRCAVSPGGGGEAGMKRTIPQLKRLDALSAAGGIWLYFMYSIGEKTGKYL